MLMSRDVAATLPRILILGMAEAPARKLKLIQTVVSKTVSCDALPVVCVASLHSYQP
jgi:hypothetical protein